MTGTGDRESRIRRCLDEKLRPIELALVNQSHLHAGHEGAREGKGHFDMLIVSEVFEGKSRIERHRLVYEAIADLLESDIHALRIQAFAPSERRSRAARSP